MEVVFRFKSENYAKAKDILSSDDIISRASLAFKDGAFIGKDGYYCYLSGTGEQCERAKELVKEFIETVTEEEKALLINKIKEEENKAIEGFGNILS